MPMMSHYQYMFIIKPMLLFLLLLLSRSWLENLASKSSEMPLTSVKENSSHPQPCFYRTSASHLLFKPNAGISKTTRKISCIQISCNSDVFSVIVL